MTAQDVFSLLTPTGAVGVSVAALWHAYQRRADAQDALRAKAQAATDAAHQKDRDDLVAALRDHAAASATRTELIVRAMADSSAASQAMARAVEGITATVRDLGERVSRLERADSERVSRVEAVGAR